MAAWEMPVGIVLVIFGGVSLALQSGVNASLGSHITKPLASVVSFAMGLGACCIYLLIDATAVSQQLPSAADVKGAPWWSWIGGVLGAYYVIVNIIFAYKLGAGTAISVFVCSQLSMSIILDLTGLVGFQKRAFSWPRITGAALMIMGVILVTQFPGAPITPPKKPEEQPAQQPQAKQQQAQPQQQQQQQAHAKQLKQIVLHDQLQGASTTSLLPTAVLGGGGSSSSSLSTSSGSVGSLELAAAAGGSSSSNSRMLSDVGAMRAVLQHRHPQQHQQHPQHSDVQVNVVGP